MTTKLVKLHKSHDHQWVGANAAGNTIVVGDPAKATWGPMEMLLVALGSCVAQYVLNLMQASPQAFENYQIEIEAEQAESQPQRYTSITVRHIAQGVDVTEAEFRRIADLALTQYCAVAASLNAEMKTEVVIAATAAPVVS